MIDAKLRAALSRAATAERDNTSAYTSPYDTVAETDNANLHCFGDPALPPVLIVYSLVNRPAILDLSPQRSVIATLKQGGVCPYLLDWHEPGVARRYLSLSDYIVGDIAEAVQWLNHRHHRTPFLLGVCQGGVLALCHAAIEPDSIAGLILLATPWNTDGADNRLAQIARRIDLPALTAATGNINGPGIATVFAALKPFALGPQRYGELAALADADDKALSEFIRMERWMYDGPDLAGMAFAEFAEQIYQKNALANATLQIESQTVDLKAIHTPLFNTYAIDDHLVPPSASQGLSQVIHGPVTEMALAGGHLGLFIGRRAYAELYPALLNWLHKHST